MGRKSTYIVAEIGINHNGLLDNCYKLISAAAEAGCNAVKFQYFRPEYLYPKSAGKLDWKDAKKKYSYNIYEATEKNKLPPKWIAPLIRYSKAKKVDFFSSIFDAGGVDYLIKKGMRKIKLSSYTITNLPLVEHCAKTKLPIIMSTGGADFWEIQEALEVVLKYHKNISLLHCSLNYPTSLKDCNLGVIGSLKQAFPGIPIGFSDHTAEISYAPVQAIYLGAQIIEKHITLNKAMPGPDHFFALDPLELKQMVKDIRKAERDVVKGKVTIDKIVYGNPQKKIHIRERYLRDFCFMCLFSKRHIKESEKITVNDISILRPGKKERGLEPKYLKLFEKCTIRAKSNIACEDPITWKKILIT